MDPFTDPTHPLYLVGDLFSRLSVDIWDWMTDRVFEQMMVWQCRFIWVWRRNRRRGF